MDSTCPKQQLIDPLGSMCRLILLNFEPIGTKISISDHAIEFYNPNNKSEIRKWLERRVNGDSMEDISHLYNFIVRLIDWYVVPTKLKHKNGETTTYLELEKMCKYMCQGLQNLQKTYNTGNVVFTLQYYILYIQSSISDIKMTMKPLHFLDSDPQTFIDKNRIIELWDDAKIIKMCELCDKAFAENMTDKKEFLTGHLTAIKDVLDNTAKSFRILVNTTISS
jgi:hypothetical protein